MSVSVAAVILIYMLFQLVEQSCGAAENRSAFCDRLIGVKLANNLIQKAQYVVPIFHTLTLFLIMQGSLNNLTDELGARRFRVQPRPFGVQP